MPRPAFYRFFRGDYLRDAGHLSMLEHGAYRLLIDLYMDRGGPIPADLSKLFRLLHATTPDEQAALKSVLAEFFSRSRSDDGSGYVYKHKRCQAELSWQVNTSAAARANIDKRWRKKGPKNQLDAYDGITAVVRPLYGGHTSQNQLVRSTAKSYESSERVEVLTTEKMSTAVANATSVLVVAAKNAAPTKVNGHEVKTEVETEWLCSDVQSPAAELEPDPDPDPEPDSNPDPPGFAPCPVTELIALWHELLPEAAKVLVVDDERRKLLRARWRQLGGIRDYRTRSKGLAEWRRLFEFIRKSPFLLGKADPLPGRKPFELTLDFVLRPSRFRDLTEGKYHRS